MLNITFTESAELLKPIELIREPMPGKDAPPLTAERDARSYSPLPLHAWLSRVNLVGRARGTVSHFGDGARKRPQGPPCGVGASEPEGWEAEGQPAPCSGVCSLLTC